MAFLVQAGLFAFVCVLIFAAIAFGTVTVKIETVVSQANAMFCGDFTLTRFDGIITKFDNLTAVEADQMIVVMLLCQFKYGFTAFKIVAGDDTSVMATAITCSSLTTPRCPGRPAPSSPT